MIGIFIGDEGESDDKNWCMVFAWDEATPTMSYYLFCTELPTKISFGVNKSQPQFLVTIQ